VAAWGAWSVIHILFLIGFRSKVLVMLGWIYNYLLRELGARLITGTIALRIREPRHAEHVHVQPRGGAAPAVAPPPAQGRDGPP
jgi:NADH dehydrogenase